MHACMHTYMHMHGGCELVHAHAGHVGSGGPLRERGWWIPAGEANSPPRGGQAWSLQDKDYSHTIFRGDLGRID